MSLQDRNAKDYAAGGPEDEAMRKKGRQRQTVRWVLGAPDRLKGLVEGDRIEEATKDWEEVQKLLRKWNEVPGVDEVRQQCLSIMSGDASDNAG